MSFKKNISKNILLLLALTFILASSCKKYPDGPLLSLRTKQHRICGDWKVEYFSINGYDSTAYLQSQNLYGFYVFSEPKEGHPGDFAYNSFGNYSNDSSLWYSSEGTWEFKDNKESLHIRSRTYHSKHFNIGAFAADNVTWEIRRLKEKEMWLKTTYIDGREYFIKFKYFKAHAR